MSITNYKKVAQIYKTAESEFRDAEEEFRATISVIEKDRKDTLAEARRALEQYAIDKTRADIHSNGK